MVSHTLYQGIEITILVGGQTLEEYPCKNDEVQHEEALVRTHQTNCTITRYVEAHTGKKFAISFKVSPSFKEPCGAISFSIFVDGRLFGALYMIEKERKKDCPWTATFQGYNVYEGKNCVGFKPMEFADIITNDEPSRKEVIDEQIEQISKAGEIVVYVRRKNRPMIKKSLKPLKERVMDLDNETGEWIERLIVREHALKGHAKMHWIKRVSMAAKEPEAEPMMINERAMKGSSKSHTTNLGPSMPTQKCENWTAMDADDYYLPRIIAVFKYRSDKALKSLGVKEATPELEDDTTSSLSEVELITPVFIIDDTPEPEEGPMAAAVVSEAITPLANETIAPEQEHNTVPATTTDENVSLSIAVDENPKSEEEAPAARAPAKIDISQFTDAEKNQLLVQLYPNLEQIVDDIVAKKLGISSNVKAEASASLKLEGGVKRESKSEDANPRPSKRAAKAKIKTTVEFLDSDSEHEHEVIVID